jgi:uncharacterized protein YbaR (Trm112 family)
MTWGLKSINWQRVRSNGGLFWKRLWIYKFCNTSEFLDLTGKWAYIPSEKICVTLNSLWSRSRHRNTYGLQMLLSLFCWSISPLLNNAISTTETKVVVSRKITANDESLRIWKEAVLAFLPVLLQHSPGETKTKIQLFGCWNCVAWLPIPNVSKQCVACHPRCGDILCCPVTRSGLETWSTKTILGCKIRYPSSKITFSNQSVYAYYPIYVHSK